MPNKVVFIGNTNVGKTAIINVAMNQGIDARPTVGALSHAVSLKTGNRIPVSVNLWDTAGQEIYNSMVPCYVASAVLVVVVMDLSEPNFENLPKWINIAGDRDNTNLILVQNKLDLVTPAAAKFAREEADRSPGRRHSKSPPRNCPGGTGGGSQRPGNRQRESAALRLLIRHAVRADEWIFEIQ
jgi:Ras-related protein Rab-6A